MNCLIRLPFVLLIFVSLLWSLPAYGQDDLPPEIKQALEKINQESVTETIKFLASDEMAGRDTPSPELTKAGDYVAERFRKAGLIGGEVRNGNRSFFHTHTIPTVGLEQNGIEISHADGAIQQFGMLAAGEKEYSFNGVVSIADNDRSAKYDGPVLIDGSKIKSTRGLGGRLRRYKQQGATCVLIKIDSDHPLTMDAKVRARQRIVGRRGISIPTLLVAEFDVSKEITLKIPAQKKSESEVRNIIGMIKGSDPELANEAVIFTAHLDHIGLSPGRKDPINNGADDDATGVTAVLSLADAFGSLNTAPKRTIIFMTFWGEEKGLLGSRNYTSRPSWPLDKTVVNINIEMIGRPESGAHEKVWMTGWDKSDLGSIMAKSSKRVGILVFEHPRFSQMLYGASDNASFVAKGVIAHSFSAGSIHKDYHQPSDEWEKLELRHMTRVIEGLFVGSLPLVNGEATPQKTTR